MVNNRKSNEKLWSQAVKSNDVELAIKTAGALNDPYRLRLIALEGWAKQQFSVVEKACLKLGFKLDKNSCKKIEKIIEKNNCIAKQANDIYLVQEKTLILQYVFDCLFYANQEGVLVKKPCIMVIKSKAKLILTTLDESDYEIIFCELMNGDYKHVYKPYSEAYQIFPTIEQQNLFEKIARHDSSAVIMELIPKKTLDTTKNEKKVSSDTLGQVLSDLENYNNFHVWERFCDLLVDWDEKEIELSPQQISQIEDKLRFWSDDSRFFRYENTLPATFARKITFRDYRLLDKYIEKSSAIKNITYLDIDRRGIFEAALANSHVKEITTLKVADFNINVSQELLTNALWLGKLKKLLLYHQGIWELTTNFLNLCPLLEEIETYAAVKQEAAAALAKLENLNSLSIGGFFAQKEFLESLLENRLKKLKITSTYMNVEDLKQFLKTPKLGALIELEIRMELVEVDMELIEILTQSSHLANLQTLIIGDTSLAGLDLISHIANSPYLTNLRHLKISDVRINSKIATNLANSSTLKNLETLDLSFSKLKKNSLSTILTSPSLSKLKNLILRENKIDAEELKALEETTLISLSHLNLSYCKTSTSAIAEVLINWPGLANLEVLDITSFCKKGQKTLCSSEYLQKAQVKGLTEFPDLGNWRNIGKHYSDKVYETITIVGQRQEIVQKVKEQMCAWAEKYKILLSFQSEKPVIKVDVKDLNSSIFLDKQKDDLGEPKITDEEYATSLLEEAKRKLADKHQKHIAEVYNRKLGNK